jgi:hypothetical protein
MLIRCKSRPAGLTAGGFGPGDGRNAQVGRMRALDEDGGALFEELQARGLDGGEMGRREGCCKRCMKSAGSEGSRRVTPDLHPVAPDSHLISQCGSTACASVDRALRRDVHPTQTR